VEPKPAVWGPAAAGGMLLALTRSRWTRLVESMGRLTKEMFWPVPLSAKGMKLTVLGRMRSPR